MSWYDNRLQWDPEEYGDIHVIKLPNTLLWQPDIVLMSK